jgi:hypothetical protein
VPSSSEEDRPAEPCVTGLTTGRAKVPRKATNLALGKRVSLERLLSGENTLISPLKSQDPVEPPLKVCVFITTGSITKLFAGGGGTREEPGTSTQGAPVFPAKAIRN